MQKKLSFFWEITQRRVVITYRRFGATLKMEPISCPETSVRNYHSALRNILEKRRSQVQNNSAGRRKNIKWAIITTGPIRQGRMSSSWSLPVKSNRGKVVCNLQRNCDVVLTYRPYAVQPAFYLITKWTKIYKFYYISSRTSLTTISYCYSAFMDHNVCKFALQICQDCNYQREINSDPQTLKKCTLS